MVGLPYWEAPERTRRFREFVAVVHRLLTSPVTTYEGQYYQTKKAVTNPAPIQEPHPRLMLAAHGETTLRLAASLADTWNTFVKFKALPDEALDLACQHNRRLNEL